MNYGNTSVPNNNTSTLDVSLTAIASPCSGCDYAMTTFSVSGGQGYYDDKSQSLLSTGQIQSSHSIGEFGYMTQFSITPSESRFNAMTVITMCFMY